MKVKQTWYKRFKGWLLSVILIDIATHCTRFVEFLFRKETNLITIFFTEGNFADNSRYFLEYLLRTNEHGFTVRVLVLRKDLYIQIANIYPDITVNAKSLNGALLFLRTKNIVISHGSDTSYFFPYFLDVKSKNIINLWHGIPLKRLSLQVRGIRDSKSRNRFQKFTSICASSHYEQMLLAACFDMHIDDVWVTGTPRNDYLLEPRNDLLTNHPYLKERVILYAPTWREYGDRSSFFPFEDRDLDKLNLFLEKQGAYILIRGHREEMERIYNNYDQNKSYSRILPAHQEVFPDAQQLLAHTDLLITDYSSIYLDYLLLDKPMIFIPYDLNLYQSYRGFLFDYDSHTPGPKVFSQSDMQVAIANSFSGYTTFDSKRREMIRLFHKYSDSNASERIVERIKSLNS